MIRLKVMALSVFCLAVAVLTGCYGVAEITIEVGEQGPFKPRFVGNGHINYLQVSHVYGWPEWVPSDDPSGKLIGRHENMWELGLDNAGELYESIDYGSVPSGYKADNAIPLELGKLYKVESTMVDKGHPAGLGATGWFCILEDETGEARLIELTFRASRHSDLDPPFNEVRLELEEGTGKILKIIPVE